MGLDPTVGPEAHLQRSTAYHMEPDEGPDTDWRLDIIAASTCCSPILNDYLNNEGDYTDALHANGIAPGALACVKALCPCPSR